MHKSSTVTLTVTRLMNAQLHYLHQSSITQSASTSLNGVGNVCSQPKPGRLDTYKPTSYRLPL